MHLMIRHFGFTFGGGGARQNIASKSRVSILRVEFSFFKLSSPPYLYIIFLLCQTSLYSAFCFRVNMLIFIHLRFSMFLILLFVCFCYVLLSTNKPHLGSFVSGLV